MFFSPTLGKGGWLQVPRATLGSRPWERPACRPETPPGQPQGALETQSVCGTLIAKLTFCMNIQVALKDKRFPALHAKGPGWGPSRLPAHVPLPASVRKLLVSGCILRGSPGVASGSTSCCSSLLRGTREAAADGQGLEFLPPSERLGLSSGLTTSAWPSRGRCRSLGNKPVNVSLYFSNK